MSSLKEKQKIEYSPEQKLCLETKNKNLLVSASAGSGKTFVLIKKIENIVINREAKVNELLVVTFTKAAAAEMKSRLVKALEAIEPKDDYIKEQLFDVASSNISTLHSFCSRLLKTYFYEVGLDPAFSLIDDLESSVLKQKALTKMIDNGFLSADEDFLELYEMYSKNRCENNFRQLILQVFNFLNNIVDSNAWFESFINSSYQSDLSKNTCASYLNNCVIEQFGSLHERGKQLLFRLNTAGEAKIIELINGAMLNVLKIKPDNSFEQNRKNAQIFEPMATFRATSDNEGLLSDCKLFYSDVRVAIKKAQELYLLDCSDNLSEKLKNVKRVVLAIKKYETEFRRIYNELKREKVVLDYNDLEKFTLDLLKIESVRNQVKNSFKYVFVDEYQDVNEVQEEIIKNVTTKNNLFMVGDVKQSIYRFRGSEPDIFVNKYTMFKSGKSDTDFAIDLNSNFRSHPDILAFCNEIFSKAMTYDFGGVNYIKDAMLVSASNNNFNTNNEKVVNIDIIQPASEKIKDEDDINLDVYSVKEHHNEVDESIKNAEAEGVLVAKRIKQIVDGDYDICIKDGNKKKLGYNDIAILTQGRGEYLRLVLKQLDNANIPYIADIEDDVFDNYFLSVIKNFLSLIENKNQDLPLLAVLQSDMFNFSVNDLAIIRKNDKDSKFFYQAFENSLNNEGVPSLIRDKVFDFSSTLNKFNFLSKFTPVDTLITMALKVGDFDKTILKQPDGIYIIETIQKLLLAINGKSYNSSLSQFLVAINDNPIKLCTSSSDSGVTVTTIHKSKGLEYPVVIVIGAGRSFFVGGGQDKIKLELSNKLGVGVPSFNINMHTFSKSLCEVAIAEEQKSQTLKEKLRLLYVALTRAVNYLFVIGSKGLKIEERKPSEAKCFLDWIVPIINKKQEGGMLSFSDFNVNYYKTTDLETDITTQNLQSEYVFGDGNAKLEQEIEKVLNYEYPYKLSCEMPIKTSVSELLHKEVTEVEDAFVPKVFNFISGETAIKKGVAYHKIMQSVNITDNTKEKLDETINNLIKQGTISVDDVKLVNKTAILNLLNDGYFAQICKDSVILKEQQFIALTKLAQSDVKLSENDSVILQGVIDFVAIKGDKAVVIDFKTNAWKTEDKYITNYSKQLDMYAKVVAESFKINKVEKLIYSFTMQKFIKIK